jgi:3-deoxy-D-manno-octulosonate 8-phosphate phosphatase (KDO 8-P phosphatase)
MKKPDLFVLDLDGVMTDGKFYYTKLGKIAKKFGPDDGDALNILKKYLKIIFVSADKKGFPVSKKRIQIDMHFKIYLVPAGLQREIWLKKKFKNRNIIYMGDGIFDSLIMKNFFYSISPRNSDEDTKKNAKYITKRDGGDRAVSEAVKHILKKFYSINNIKEIIK